MPVLIRFSMPPIAFWQQSGRTCSLNIRILSLNFDYLLKTIDFDMNTKKISQMKILRLSGTTHSMILA